MKYNKYFLNLPEIGILEYEKPYSAITILEEYLIPR